MYMYFRSEARAVILWFNVAGLGAESDNLLESEGILIYRLNY